MLYEYETFLTKLKLILNSVVKEYDSIIKEYDTSRTYEKSVEYLNENYDYKNINDLKNNLKIFLEENTSMIDNACATLRPYPGNLDDYELNFVYKVSDIYYSLRYVRYNIIMSFIMQIYLIFEKELVYFVNDNYNMLYDNNKIVNNLFNALIYFEKQNKYKYESKYKKVFEKYRNVINVYKHGDGISMEKLKLSYPNMINFFGVSGEFLINLNKISVDELYDSIKGYLCIN